MTENILFVLVSFLLGFTGSQVPVSLENHPVFPYDLDHPNASFEMPESLKEISGLSLTADGQSLAAINDEDGIVYLLDKLTCTLTQQIEFGNGGDYEGVEIVGDDAWIIKSSGTLYQVVNFRSEHPEVHKISSFLNKENDVEGLAYDPKKHCLYVGCKGKASVDDGTSFEKAVYEFDLKSMSMKNEPVYLLTLPDIQEYLKHLVEHDGLDELQERFNGDGDELKFSPSGIAIHPQTCDIYVTSSKGKMLLVLSPQGKILHLVKLKKKIHVQPEGICFDTDGTLYIANEGKDDKALVYRFLYHPGDK